MLLVTAATGQVGREAVQELVAAGAAVRALVRDPGRAEGLEGAEVVQGDFDDDVSLGRALEGVEAMLLAGRDGPEAVAQHRRALAGARRAGVRHVVRLSAIGAAVGSPVELMRDHAAVDEELRRGPSGWTLLRPHLYLQNLLRSADAVRRDGVLAGPLGEARVPLVDTRDIGAAAAAVLAAPAAHAGRVYALTGPAALGYHEVAAALADVAGRRVSYESVSPEAYELELLARGLPAWRAFDLAHIASAYTGADNAVAPDLGRLLGRPPRSLARFLEDHRAVFAADE